MNELLPVFETQWSSIKVGPCAPKGNRDDLEAAKRQLRPFRSEHLDGLLHLCPCEPCAEKWIVDIAARFNRQKLLIQHAPRPKAMVQAFQEISDAASRLASSLIQLDDYSRDYLVNLDTFDAAVFGRSYASAAAHALPTPETEENGATDGLFAETLLKLASYVSRRSEHLIEGNGVKGAVDKGGNTNVLKRRFGPVAIYLVDSCWDAFENQRPGMATATEGGPFVTFVNAVYSYATGAIEENSTLQNWIKKRVKLHRHHIRCLRQYWQIETELHQLQELASEATRSSILELEQRLAKALEEIGVAGRALNAQVFGSGKLP